MPKWILLGLALWWGAFSRESEVTFFLAGDSTMSVKPDSLLEPERGWGMMLPDLFKPELAIENHARNGRSTRTFISEGRWQTIVNRLRPGDFVLLQFGHNDSSPRKKDRYTPPDQYEANLRMMVGQALEKEANPMLATPIVRRRFDDSGSFYDTHGEYPDIVRRLGDELGVPVVDMHRASLEFIRALGPEGSRKVFLHIPPGKWPGLPEGLEDNTHFSPYGAREMARLFAAEIRSMNVPLARYLK